MAIADIRSRVRQILYGTGLGEKPSLIAVNDTPSGSISGPLVTFALDSGEGDKISAGDVISVWSGEADHFHVFYVTGINNDTLTGVNGYMGSPAGSTSSDLTHAQTEKLFEVNPLITMFEIDEAIDTIIARHLWPEVFNIEDKTVANPDLVDGQENVAADVMEILGAWQVIGSTTYPVAYQRHPTPVNSSIQSNQLQASFDWIDGSTGYYTAKTKIAEADEASAELTHLIAMGAAALALGGTIVEATIENTKKDNADAVSQRTQVGGLLWRDFLTLKQEYAREFTRKHEPGIVIDRG